jgi:hypothetical protein
MLLGITGDKDCSLDVYNAIKVRTLSQVRGSGRYFKRRSGAKHLYFL